MGSSANPGNTTHDPPAPGLPATVDVEPHDDGAAEDDATDIGRNINIDVYLDIDQGQRNEAGEGAQDEEEVLWRQHCSLIWPIDTLVRVRADSDFPNQTSTDGPPPYKNFAINTREWSRPACTCFPGGPQQSAGEDLAFLG